MTKIITTTDGTRLERVSRWISIQTACNVTERHALHYYAADDGDGGNVLDFFTWAGRRWAIGQFYAFGTMFTPQPPPMWEEADGLHWVSGYDAENYHNPILIELDEYCERVRIYRKEARPLW